MRPISLAALTVLELSPVEAIRVAARCGYSHVGLRPVAATAEERQPAMLHDEHEAQAIRSCLAQEGLAVLDVEIVRLTDAIDWDRMERVLAFGQSVGADRLLVADNDPDPVRSRESLCRLAERGKAYGVRACVEFMPWTCASDLAAALDRVGGIANAAILVDAFHLARSGGTTANVAAAGQSVSYLQLCDIAGPIPDMDQILREARGDRLLPGDGECDLVGLLRALPHAPVSLEIPLSPARYGDLDAQQRAERAIAATRKLLAEADG